MSADIEPLPGLEWGAKASAGDAFSRVGNDDPFFAMWIDSDGTFRYSKTDLTAQQYATFAIAVQTMAERVFQDVIGIEDEE